MEILANSEQWQKIVNLIIKKGPLSRSQIIKTLKISQPSVTRLTEQLINKGIIVECGVGISSGGRKPVFLNINPDYSYLFGIELGRAVIKISLVNLMGEILSTHQAITNNAWSLNKIFEYIKVNTTMLLKKHKINVKEVLGVGVGVPGPLNIKQDGTIHLTNFYNVKNIKLKEKLKTLLNLPVELGINANVATLAESWYGKGKKHNNFIYILADDGVGSGMVIDGKLYSGSHKASGVIGHTNIDKNRDKCICGNIGCLETMVSTTKILKNIKKHPDFKNELHLFHNSHNLTLDIVKEALIKKSKVAKSVINEMGSSLGIGIANTINLLDPEAIILGGRISEFSFDLTDPLKEMIKKKDLEEKSKNIPIYITTLQDNVVLGAATLILNSVLNSNN